MRIARQLPVLFLAVLFVIALVCPLSVSSVLAQDVCEGDFDCDGDQDGTDAAVFKIHFGRGEFTNPCEVDDPCYGDFDEDGDADGTDAATFKLDFGRSEFVTPCPACDRPIGVLFVVHGGMTTFEPQYLWDAMVHQFSYDPNHSVYKFVIWNSSNWPLVLDMEYGFRFFRMYDFAYDRIGGLDPFHGITDQQLLDIKANLDANEHGLTFEVDWSAYMAAAHPAQYAYPRFLYYGPDGPDEGDNLTYCAGEGEPGGPWPSCDPERFNVDGPVERMVKEGAYRIMVIDWNMGGPRFSKTFDVVEMSKRALEDWKTKYGVTVPLTWVNDYSNLMEESYPKDEGWTRILKDPIEDNHVLLNGRPNPVVLDPVVVDLQVEAIEAAFSNSVLDADTGVAIFNHALHDYNEWFDPKVNDTLLVCKKIKEKLLELHPTMDPDNIIGVFGGIQVENPENHDLEERNRPMRGESYGHAWLYQTDKVMPGDEWGYLYWDGLEYLKNRGVNHIVIGFPQVVADNALNMIEIPNQVAARVIGYKNWLKWGTGDYDKYPTEGHPFPDYWGNWVDTDCGEWELNYDSGTPAFSEKATVTGDSSGATGVIKWFSGDTSSGTLVLKELTGTFENGELITDDKGGSASANGIETMTSKPECCFEMGGCGDPLRPYPPVRQTPYGEKMTDLDPHLCFDMSEYGHRGYDPLVGPPDPEGPVQEQYTGTWEMYSATNDDPRVGEMLARHVLDAIIKPMPYITNGDIEGISEGGSVTFDAHVETGGSSPYTYEWSTNKDEAGWVSQGTGSSWMFNTAGGDAGTYDVRCIVTDSQSETGEVIWEDFEVSTP
jgi:hypothetical protein